MATEKAALDAMNALLDREAPGVLKTFAGYEALILIGCEIDSDRCAWAKRSQDNGDSDILLAMLESALEAVAESKGLTVDISYEEDFASHEPKVLS